MFTLEVHPGPDHLVLRAVGELDLHTSPTFRNQLIDLIEEARQPIVLDLCDLQFIDSSGLGALLAMIRIPAERRPHLVLAPSEGHVARLLHITRLDSILPLHPSIAAALASTVAAASAA